MTSISAITPMVANAPIGVFDSGVGGLSVLRHIRAHLPNEHLVYFSDAQFAPYGHRPAAEIEARALAIGAYLIQRGVKAIVVACNTATAVAIAALRGASPGLILIGVEPGLKPAAAASPKKIVGVLATPVTLASERFALLREQISASTGATFLLQPCPGLVEQIEAGALDTDATISLLRTYVLSLLTRGADTLVLGCTHYPFLLPQIQAIVAANATQPIQIIDTGAAVTRQLTHRLAQCQMLSKAPNGALEGVTSGTVEALQTAIANLLHEKVCVTQMA